jgi:CPA2 family monovalent cation:H+ antiporter-2
MGLGLAQLGELSFVLLSEGLHANLISEVDYNRMLFVAMGTLILTPQLLKSGLRWARRWPASDDLAEKRRGPLPSAPTEAIVIGLGPIGRQAASQLEIMGIDACLIDLSPVNLHAYAQQGFRTVSGDGGDPEVLDRANAANARLAVVCVPDDRIALQIVKTLCRLNPQCAVVVRCRYQGTGPALRKAGAHTTISEEAEASVALIRLLQRMKSA